MNRADILAEYKVENGVIRSPGQFEGEAVYVPYYWRLHLDGLADRDNGRTVSFDVDDMDRLEFPELKRRRCVSLLQRDDGFVCEV